MDISAFRSSICTLVQSVDDEQLLESIHEILTEFIHKKPYATPEWQVQLVEDRLAEYRANPDSAISWDEAEDLINNKLDEASDED